jgi:hypothetical protein
MSRCVYRHPAEPDASISLVQWWDVGSILRLAARTSEEVCRSPSDHKAAVSKLSVSRIVIQLWNNGLMTQTITERLHIVEGSDWKDAVIALLESRSPYRPWRYGFGEAHQGDPVAVVLNTDPPSVLTGLGRIGVDGRLDRAVVEWRYPAPVLIDLATLTMVVAFEHDQDPRHAWQLRGDAAIQMELALTECAYRDDSSMRFEHTCGSSGSCG